MYVKFKNAGTSFFVDVDDLQKINHYRDKTRKAQGWEVVTDSEGKARLYAMPTSAKVAAVKQATTASSDPIAAALKAYKEEELQHAKENK